MKISQHKVDELIPYARNSRTHSDAQVAQIAASIKEFGFTNPVLIDETSSIIAGHGRVLASRKLNLVTVPCIQLSHLTEAQKKAYVIADNKLALNAGWDDEMLAVELADLKDMGFDLDLTGFTLNEFQAILPIENYPESSAKEIDPDNYKMSDTCPKCGFEFNAKT
jgi:ParB-like chromosome segregation protein Spo0J